MHLRPMQLWDLPVIADLSAETQLENEIAAFVAPHRRKYYASYRNGFLRRYHARMLRPGWFYWVAETDPGDVPTVLQNSEGEKECGGHVVGFAAWTREGKSPVARNWQKMNEGWLTRSNSYMTELQNKYWAFFKLDWSGDSSRYAIITELFDQTFPDDIFPEAWLLANLVVHKDYQRRGIGALLVRWGLDQCEAERVPCGVESSVAGFRLYEKVGFRKFDEMRFGEKEEETFSVMVWEPSGLEGHWFDKAMAAADAQRREISNKGVR